MMNGEIDMYLSQSGILTSSSPCAMDHFSEQHRRQGRAACRSCCGCSKCSDCCDRRTLLIAAWAVGAFILVVLLIVVIVWLVLRPTKPSFHLKNTTVYKFNLSLSDNILSAVVQATVSFHNPDGRVGVYYGGGDVYASYQDQQITLPPRHPSGLPRPRRQRRLVPGRSKNVANPT
ncbi:hypothetical protein C4D60_Mb06t08190 [Musa balbisiana]|uniref:Late embryogenesis abundant protein LEA-2 subgroup domain-containing protein n=1 Tax=Musa balbisiana TaxID=52838 RepID=A0A4S8ILH8_MUSBA|nr:hypothetical protein C4D60_Mb06t08190 [Musa balbisiana]